MGEDIAFQVDVLFQNITVAVRLGDEFTALSVDKQRILPVHGFHRAQAPTIVLVITYRNAVFRHRSQPLIIGQVIDCGVRGDIARIVITKGCSHSPGALVDPVKSIESDRIDSFMLL